MMNDTKIKKKAYNETLNHKTLTLDKNHDNKVKEFDHIENVVIPQLHKQKHELLQKLKTNDIQFESQLDLKDEILEINKKIKELKYKKKQYYSKNVKYVFNYFEDKKNISNNKNEKKIVTKNVVNKFFNIHKDDNDTTLTTTSSCQCKQCENCMQKLFAKEILNHPIKHNIDNTLFFDYNNNNVERYFNNVNNTIVNLNSFIYSTDICQKCKKGELIRMDDDDSLMCDSCSQVISFLSETEKPSYKEPPKEVASYAYERINHFKEIIAQFQGKQTTNIKPYIINNIKRQAKKNRIPLGELTNEITREILKNLGYSKYYEHVTYINSKFGIQPPIFSNELEETLCNLFIEIQLPYSKCCPDDRTNFLNYYYTVFKLCELINERSYLPALKLAMLKDRDKIIEQDVIWKQMCQYLNWKFIPTV